MALGEDGKNNPITLLANTEVLSTVYFDTNYREFFPKKSLARLSE